MTVIMHMIKHSGSSKNAIRQAGDDFVITDEMIEAGLYVLLDYECDEVQSPEVAKRVYLAMDREKKPRRRSAGASAGRDPAKGGTQRNAKS